MPPRQVGPVPDQKGWGNVMYIPAAPYCAKNAAYANDCGKAFLTGESPSDFAPEHYE
ncbi:YbiU family protein, partial [Amycolatopsis sp.]|uniref:YbiU family protein n=1 Tax=Amycolatopsis sp. TaxID=37632 RepID=UPI002DFB52A7|nr:YbiU family protein [Amycolatopsis sp.]